MRLPKKWAVSFMSWEKYLGKVVDMDEELSGYRIIVGGASLDQDLLEPKMLFFKNPETLPRYLLGVEALSETVWITPSPKECLYLGDKIQLAAVLTDIAMRHGWQCPKVVQVPPQTGKEEFSMIDWKETVAKRTFSCEGKHVILPTDSTLPDRAFLQNLDATHRHWQKKTHPAVRDLEPVWFLQPFNQDLINKGNPGHQDDPLSEEMLESQQFIEWNCTEIGIELGKRGRDELLAFAETNLRELIQDVEKNFADTPFHGSDLRLFARLDIGVFRRKEKYQYYVHEVQPWHGADWFSGYADNQASTITATILECLEKRIDVL
ncbi:hypothetical protein IMY05_C4779000200 [Salix suchowensis]|nr:hypothetical protein IMY05_C4779000200 [Salix suchowensis]